MRYFSLNFYENHLEVKQESFLDFLWSTFNAPRLKSYSFISWHS